MFGDGTNSPDLNALFAQAQQMTEQLGQAQQRLAETEVTGTAGGELVTVVTTATGEVKSLTIAPEAYDGSDPDAMATIADLVIAALRDASVKARALTQEAMGPLASQVPGGLPGLPFGG